MAARLTVLLCVLLLPGAAAAFDHDHKAWDALLKQHVVLVDGGKASRVRYAGMAQDRAALKAYLGRVSAVTAGEFEGWPKPQQMAFLINAYNAFTVEKILARYPDLRSIWDFGKIFGNPFKDEFFTLLGRRTSLDGIEHGVLRKKYAEPRIHYAVNCASIGCPMLREEAYVGVRLENQLDEQARRFLSDRTRNRVRDGKLEVSKIFDWYKEDFEPRTRYFAQYAEVLAEGRERQLVRDGKLAIAFLDYDWALNDSASSSPR